MILTFSLVICFKVPLEVSYPAAPAPQSSGRKNSLRAALKRSRRVAAKISCAQISLSKISEEGEEDGREIGNAGGLPA